MKKWIKDEKWLYPLNTGTWKEMTDFHKGEGPDPRVGPAMNVMELARKICTMDKMKMYRIVHEAYEFAKREGEGGRKNYGIDEADMWTKTDQYYTGKRTIKHGTIRFSRPKDWKSARGARGGPSYGITVPLCGGAGRLIEVIVHEITHVIHLSRYKSSIINGKRRPHDLVFNRIFLKLMKPIMGLKESETNPFNMGYSVGKGYAPSRKIERMLNQMVKDRDEKIMRLFKYQWGGKPTKKRSNRIPRGWINHVMYYINGNCYCYYSEEAHEQIVSAFPELIHLIANPKDDNCLIDMLKGKAKMPDDLPLLIERCIDEIVYSYEYESEYDSCYNGYIKTVESGHSWFINWSKSNM